VEALDLAEIDMLTNPHQGLARRRKLRESQCLGCHLIPCPDCFTHISLDRIGDPQCGQHAAQKRPAARMGVCKTAGVQPHVLQACLFPLVRMQFRGPGLSRQTFGLAFVPCIAGAPKVRPTPGCGKPKRQNPSLSSYMASKVDRSLDI